MKSTKIDRLGLELVQKCVEILLVTGLDNKLLFQNEVSDYEIAKELLTNGLSKNDVNKLECFDEVCSIHVSLTLKLFLQCLHNPLLTEALFDDFIETTSKLKSDSNSFSLISFINLELLHTEKLHEITFLVNHLPPINYEIVKSLMTLLNK